MNAPAMRSSTVWALLMAACASALIVAFASPGAPALGAPAQQQTPTPAPVTLSGVLRRGQSPGCPAALWRIEPCDGGAPTLIGSSASLALESYADLEVSLTGRVRACPSGGTYIDVTAISPHPCAVPTALPSDPNLALGKPVQIPPDNPDRQGGRINDGDTNSTWRAPGTGVSWLYVDLQSERSVHKFVLRWADGHAARYGIYMWDPGNGANGDWSALYFNPNGQGGDETIVVPLVRAQVFLMYLVTPAKPDLGFELREWEVYGTEMTNLARGHHVDASTERPLNPARDAVDGDANTAWHGEPARRTAQPTWLRVVYSPLRADISAIRILWASGFALQYRVHFRADGEWLKAQFPLENDKPDWPNTISWRFPLSVDEVWIVIDQSDVNHDHVGIRELELYAQPPGQSAAVFTSLDPRRALTGDVIVQGARLRAGVGRIDGANGETRDTADVMPDGAPDGAPTGFDD